MNELWIDTRLSNEEMNFLWQIISEENKEDISKKLAGNISKSEIIIDKDNKVAIYYCPKCEEFTSYDEWAQPGRACINCAE